MIEALEMVEASKWGNDDNIIEVNLANAITMLVLGIKWFERFGQLGLKPDPWMMNANDEWLAANPMAPDVRRIVFHQRMVRLGDALGTLITGGNAIGTYVLIERLRSRQDTRSSFLETEIAAMLTKNGAKVDGIKESGKKGEDFDLLVTHKGVQISVEVTAASAAVPTERVIINKLKEKARQVPINRPAVLYLYIPPSWMRKPYGKRVLGPPISRFIRGSHRFNMIVLVWEDVLPNLADGGGFPEMTMRPIYSHVARYSLPDPLLFTPTRGKDGNLRASLRLLDIVKQQRDRMAASGVPGANHAAE